MESHPLVSVVFLCWNRKEDVRNTLEELRELEYPHIEVIAVDNASSDGTSTMVTSDFPEVRLIQMPDNQGISGYNVGFNKAQGDYIVILDDDSYPAPDAIGKMVERFDADSQLGVVAFDVRNASAKNSDWQPPSDQPKSQYQMSFNGAGVGIRTELFRHIGWYPAEFFLYWNEQDTAFRVLAAGYKIETFADIVAWHKFSPRNRASERAPFFYTRNAFWVVWKNYPLDMAIVATLRLVYGCIYHSMEQKTIIYLKALSSAFLHINKLRGLRSPLSRQIVQNARVAFELAFSQFR